MTDSSISTDLVRMLLGGAPLANGAVANILSQAGIPPQALASPRVRISVSQLEVIWTEIESSAGDPNLGLHLGELRDGIPSGHVLFAAMWNSPTLGQALERYCRFHDIMGDLVQPRLEPRGEATVFRLHPRPGVTLHRQHVECIFSLLVSIMKRLVPARFAGEIRFSHPAPADTSEHHRILGPAVRFSARQDEVRLDPAYLEHPIAAADDQLLGVLEQYAERLLRGLQAEPTWSARVSEAMGRDLCDGPPTLLEVARQLGVSQRTLQSRLKEEGTTYQATLDNVRRQLAVAYLKDGNLSLTEVAFLLGYADQSAFNHAFRRWTGESPGQYNERLKIAH